jgi:hypothetical protein
MTVHARPEYHIRPVESPPPGYPSTARPDSFSSEPFLPDYPSRRQAFFEHILHNPAPENIRAAWYELARLAAGGQPHPGIFRAACDFIDRRQDCSDFVLHGLLRLLAQFPDDPRLSPDLWQQIRRTVLEFKYFPDEPGIDSLCTWTENHYILYASAAYLAGEWFPQAVFSNSGQTGQEKAALNRGRVLRWMELRRQTGFSEWLSHVYYDEDLTALLALYDFAHDPDIRDQAKALLDDMLRDLAWNSFRGVFGSTHGRAYENTKKWAAQEGTTDTSKLLFGTGIFSGFDNMSAAAFALSGYRLPPEVEAAAAETGPFEYRRRMGLRLEEMERWGLRADNFEDGMHLLTLEAYFHPRTINNTLLMFDRCNWWENSFLSPVKPYRGLLRGLRALGGLPLLARALERDVCRNTREEVNIYTCKTPDYMLSCAQDYRKGHGGDQQHIWQATLGPDAVCFTTHPARLEGPTPNYWAGSGLLPRAAQFRNVLVALYRLESIPALYVPTRLFFTHAWLPRDAYDEVLERAGWIFARKGDGYLALRSSQPVSWREAANGRPEDVGRELIAQGRETAWICHLGRRAEDGEFAAFVEAVSAAEVRFEGLGVMYAAPGVGLVRFGWDGPLTVEGESVPLDGYPREGEVVRRGMGTAV